MEKLVISHILVVALLFSGMCAVPHANAATCTEILDPRNCSESDCLATCHITHPDPAQQALGACRVDSLGTAFCVCFFNC
ncbi:hypothetical protein ACJRO7_002496 [Eucalyptus globulus]|uniref:Defensin-like protein n=1 Tax=Eucalyptus globulus TaxID=34317 RepID=A0ABD3LUJ7_EUCGL